MSNKKSVALRAQSHSPTNNTDFNAEDFFDAENTKPPQYNITTDQQTLLKTDEQKLKELITLLKDHNRLKKIIKTIKEKKLHPKTKINAIVKHIFLNRKNIEQEIKDKISEFYPEAWNKHVEENDKGRY